MNSTFQIERDKTKEEVLIEIANQLELIHDLDLVNKIKSHLVDPSAHLAIWDYSEKETKYPVWLILTSKKYDTAILFSEYGFGIGNWGLVTLSDNPFHFGMDFQWFETLQEVFSNSMMAD